MKRKCSLFLILCMILTLTSCGEKKTAETLVTEAVTEAPTEAETTTAAPATEEAETEAETAAEAESADVNDIKEVELEAAEIEIVGDPIARPEVLPILMTNNYETGQADDNTILYTTIYPEAHFTENGAENFAALSKELWTDTVRMRDLVGGNRSQFMETIASENLKGSEYFDGLFHHIKGTVLRADSYVVSIKHDYEGYFGSAHGDYSEMAYNYDAETGALLTISDVITDTDTFLNIVKEELQKLDVHYFDLDDSFLQYDLNATSRDDTVTMSFGLGNEAMYLWFNPYELASFADGMQEVVLPYAEYPAMFNAKYITSCENWFEPLDNYTDLAIGEDEFCLNPVYNEYGAIGSLEVVLNGNTETMETYTYSVEPYLVKNSGKYYLYVFQQGDDDETFLDVIDLNGDRAYFVGRFPYTLYVEYDRTDALEAPEGVNASVARNTTYSLIDPASFLLAGDGGCAEYHVCGNGTPARN